MPDRTISQLPAHAAQCDLIIVEDDRGLQTQMRWALKDEFAVHVAGSRASAVELLSQCPAPLVILDLGLPPDGAGTTEGMALLAWVLEKCPKTKVIIATGNSERAHAIRAVSEGAFDFFVKPLDIDVVRQVLKRALRLHALEVECQRAPEPPPAPIPGIIAASDAMIEVCKTVHSVGPTDLDILILGESGTGKDVIASALHRLSRRANGPFVTINCATLQPELLEGELFGHEHEASTAAGLPQTGKIEQAHGGTLFLDEIGEMPLPLQARILRLMQSRTFQRVGGRGEIAVDVRIVSASHRDIAGLVTAGVFREDLYSKLNEMSIVLPPLRSRRGDAVLIAHGLLDRFSQAFNKRDLKFSQSALDAIAVFGWPGNVRELASRIKRAVVLARGNRITKVELELEAVDPEFIPLREVRRKAETEAINRALSSSNYNLSRTARILGVSRPTLYSHLAECEIALPPKSTTDIHPAPSI